VGTLYREGFRLGIIVSTCTALGKLQFDLTVFWTPCSADAANSMENPKPRESNVIPKDAALNSTTIAMTTAALPSFYFENAFRKAPAPRWPDPSSHAYDKGALTGAMPSRKIIGK
jgi:hypothetical protein